MLLARHVLPEARRRLAVLDRRSPVVEAAVILSNASTPLVVVCDQSGAAVGVVSRSSIVRLFSRGSSDTFRHTAEAVMTSPILAFREDQALQHIWTALGARGLRCAPVVDDAGRPQGIIHARDLARALLDEITGEEMLLRNYVMGIGYQ